MQAINSVPQFRPSKICEAPQISPCTSLPSIVLVSHVGIEYSLRPKNQFEASGI